MLSSQKSSPYTYDSFGYKGTIFSLKIWLTSIFLIAFHSLSKGQMLNTKLICDVEVTTTFPSGTVEKIKENTQIDIIKQGPYLWIFSEKGESMISLSNRRIKNTIEASDLSTDTQYAISQHVRYSDGVEKWEKWESVTIDRVTGRLSYSSVPTQFGSALSISVTGSCKKFEGVQKKF